MKEESEETESLPPVIDIKIFGRWISFDIRMLAMAAVLIGLAALIHFKILGA